MCILKCLNGIFWRYLFNPLDICNWTLIFCYFFCLIYLFMIVGYGSQSFIIVLNYTYAILSSLFIFIKLFLCLIQAWLEWEYPFMGDLLNQHEVTSFFPLNKFGLKSILSDISMATSACFQICLLGIYFCISYPKVLFVFANEEYSLQGINRWVLFSMC